MSERVFVCGTRVVLKNGPHTFRVACASCDYAIAYYRNLESAKRACVDQSDRPCPAKPPCGAT